MIPRVSTGSLLAGNAPMNDATKGLSDDDVRGIADFIAKLPAPPPPAGPVDQDRIARARALVQQNHCDICHTPNFAGQQNVPRIGDQREDLSDKGAARLQR